MIRRAHCHPTGNPSELVGFATSLHEQDEGRTIQGERKERGQFFTPPRVARFMAALFSPFPRRVKVLDPGAGTGTLASAVCERIVRTRLPREVQLVLYETDPTLIPLLHENMSYCRSVLKEAGHRLAYDIREQDFILSNPHAFEERTLFDQERQVDEFDAVIMNPPYFKIRKISEYARMMDSIVHGQPNIYALFMALAAEMLRPGGELVAITPRSFCGGLYFRVFRRWFLKRMSLRHIHLFESRKETFCNANVLQESVITRSRRSTNPPASITITTSSGLALDRNAPPRRMPSPKVIADSFGDMVIRIPENSHDARIMDLVERWPRRFVDQDLRVSTGPVVMFRAAEFLLDSANGKNVAPLLSVHNVRPFETIWPLAKNGKPIAFKVCTESLGRKLLLPARNYVLLRRFSAKEEPRRLTASCYLKANAPAPYVALENHLNYVYHAERELSDNEVYGLVALFNSALLDRYFRTISGNTQVNATELRTINFPDLKTVARIGLRVKHLQHLTLGKADHIVLDELAVNGIVARYIMELAL